MRLTLQVSMVWKAGVYTSNCLLLSNYRNYHSKHQMTSLFTDQASIHEVVAFTGAGDQRLELATLGFSYECQAGVDHCHRLSQWSSFLFADGFLHRGISLRVICRFLSFRSILSKSNICWLKKALLSGRLMIYCDLLGICWIAGTRVQLAGFSLSRYARCHAFPARELQPCAKRWVTWVSWTKTDKRHVFQGLWCTHLRSGKFSIAPVSRSLFWFQPASQFGRPAGFDTFGRPAGLG